MQLNQKKKNTKNPLQIQKRYQDELLMQNAVKNPLLFQENNPLISESLSLLNSQIKKSFQEQLMDSSRKLNTQDDKQTTHRRKKTKLKEQSSGQSVEPFEQGRQDRSNQEEYDSGEQQMQNIRAVKQFQREIQQKFKISVSNKLYTFPRLKITSVLDIISSSSEDQECSDGQSPQNSSKQQSSQFQWNMHNPFKPSNLNKKPKKQFFEKQKQQDFIGLSRQGNFKKVKNQSSKKHEEPKKATKKTIDNKQKSKNALNPNSKRNPEVNEKERHKVNKIDLDLNNKSSKLKTHCEDTQITGSKAYKGYKLPLTGKQNPPAHNKAYRLKTQLYNDDSDLSDQMTESKKKFYANQFLLRK